MMIIDHRSIKLLNGKLVDQIKNYKQSEWMEACRKLGLYVCPSSGKGSHCAVFKDNVCLPQENNCLVITIPSHVLPNFQRDLIKKVLYHGIESGKYSEEDIWIALGVRKHHRK